MVGWALWSLGGGWGVSLCAVGRLASGGVCGAGVLVCGLEAIYKDWLFFRLWAGHWVCIGGFGACLKSVTV